MIDPFELSRGEDHQKKRIDLIRTSLKESLRAQGFEIVGFRQESLLDGLIHLTLLNAAISFGEPTLHTLQEVVAAATKEGVFDQLAPSAENAQTLEFLQLLRKQLTMSIS